MLRRRNSEGAGGVARLGALGDAAQRDKRQVPSWTGLSEPFGAGQSCVFSVFCSRVYWCLTSTISPLSSLEDPMCSFVSRTAWLAYGTRMKYQNNSPVSVDGCHMFPGCLQLAYPDCRRSCAGLSFGVAALMCQPLLQMCSVSVSFPSDVFFRSTWRSNSAVCQLPLGCSLPSTAHCTRAYLRCEHFIPDTSKLASKHRTTLNTLLLSLFAGR